MPISRRCAPQVLRTNRSSTSSRRPLSASRRTSSTTPSRPTSTQSSRSLKPITPRRRRSRRRWLQLQPISFGRCVRTVPPDRLRTSSKENCNVHGGGLTLTRVLQHRWIPPTTARIASPAICRQRRPDTSTCRISVTVMPNAAAYVGSKHFVAGFSAALRADLAGTGVIVTQVCPGPVDSEFDQAAGSGGGMAGAPPQFFRISAAQCAREAIAGFERGKAVLFPGRLYRLLMRALPLVPWWLRRKQAGKAAARLRAEQLRNG